MYRFSYLIVAVLVSLAVSACGNPEAKARGLYNQSLAAERDGNPDDSKKLLNQVVKDYPQTTAATEANQKLTALKLQEEAKTAIEAEAKIAIERQTIAIMRTINTTEVTYLSGYNNSGGRYGTIQDLNTAGLISPDDLATTQHYGITLSLGRDRARYELKAGPVGPTDRYFFSTNDESAPYIAPILHYEDGHPATATSPKLP